MKYQIGNKVILNQDYVLKKSTIPKGTKGRVTRVNYIMVAYVVDFENGKIGIIVPEVCLDIA